MSLDIRRSAVASAAALAAISAGGCGSSNDDKKNAKPKPTPPAGIITKQAANRVPLDVGRARVEALLGQKPVRTVTEDHPAEKVKLAKFPPAIRRRYRKRFGKAKNGVLTIPARSYQCLLYRGEDPKGYGWKFCLSQSDRLEFVSTTPPI